VAQALAAHLESVRERLRRAELERAAAEARAVAEARTRAVAEAKAAVERRARRLVVGLAAAVLGLVAVGAGVGLLGLLVRQKTTEQRLAIEAALDKALVLRQQARWGEVAAVLEQARQVLGDTGPEDLRHRLDVAEAELALINRLDAIRMRRMTWVGRQFDLQAAEREYAAAFREAGLGEVGDDQEAVAARVRASGVSVWLLAALDDWAWLAEVSEAQPWLLGVIRRAAPDPWGDRVRGPALWHDHQAKQALADEILRDDGARVGELSPQTLGLFGLVLRRTAAAVPLLRAAQRRYPNDFWLSFQLGTLLYEAKKLDEAVGYYRVAVALRPDAPAAHHNLGVTLADNKDLDGAIAEYKKAIELDANFAAAHYNLGNALRDKKNLDGAIAEYEKAIELDPKFAPAYFNLGHALRAKQDLDGAIDAYSKAAALPPHAAEAYSNLGKALLDKGHVEKAIAEFRKAVAGNPKFALAHFNLGIALATVKDRDGAIDAYSKATDCDGKFVQAHGALGEALMRRGRFSEARTATRRCLDLLPPGDPLRRLVSQQLQQCERLAALDEKLPAFLSGEAKPAGAAECLALAQVCAPGRRQYAAAARFYADAFAADPNLAADVVLWHRYHAACSAALAAAGQGEDAQHLPDTVVCMLRRQALAWLRDDLAAYEKLAGRDEAARQQVRQHLARWRADADLASIRDSDALDRLPDDERRAWHQLWEEFGQLLRKVELPK
jgi:tetratricopeptide (TPR) repeat protein